VTEHSTVDPPGRSAPEAQGGASFFAEASRLLADSLDYETTLATVAGLSLPYLGAWCIVDLCIEGEMRRAAVIHTDSELQALARRLESGRPPERGDPFGVPRAVETRKTEIIAAIPGEMLVKVSRGEENLQILRSLVMGSLLVVPLLARGDVLGAITYVSPQAGRAHGEDDVALAEDLAARCAIALDNARLYRTALEAQRRAQEASTAKSQFLAVMSHELRTPLTGVIAYAELLETKVLGPVEAKQQEALARIKANSWHLVSIIDEILVYSRAEAGKLEVHIEETDVAQIAREVTLVLESVAERGGVALRLECEEDAPRLWTDPGKIRVHPAGADHGDGGLRPLHVRRLSDPRAGYRAGDRTRRPGANFRTVHADGFFPYPPGRGYGSGPVDLAQAGTAPGRRHHAPEHPGRGEHLRSICPCATNAPACAGTSVFQAETLTAGRSSSAYDR
jgi:signal transduction histidine kinase